MRLISYLLTKFITSIVEDKVKESLQKPVSSDNKTVILPKALLVIGGIFCAIFFTAIIITLITNCSIGLIIILGLFSLLGLSLIIGYVNCRITYDENSFTYKNFWGVKRTFKYDEITAIEDFEMDIKLYVGKYKVKIDDSAVGKNEFLTFAKKQYRIKNDGKAIPKAKMGSDIFKGNIEQAGSMIFSYVLIGSLGLAMMLFVMIFSIPVTADDLEYKTLSFESYEVKENNLLLYTAKNTECYSIPAYYELLENPESFKELCNSGKSFEVGYQFDEETEIRYYDVYNIEGQDEQIYLTPESVYSYRWKDVWKLYLFFGIYELIWLSYVAMSIYVGRNIDKFSRKFVRLFFKDEYIRHKKNN